jgi:hypothetical protein
MPGEDGSRRPSCSAPTRSAPLGDLWVLAEVAAKCPAAAPPTWCSRSAMTPKRNATSARGFGSMMTHLWVYEGSVDAAGKALDTHDGRPGVRRDGKMRNAKVREVIEFVTPDHPHVHLQRPGRRREVDANDAGPLLPQKVNPTAGAVRRGLFNSPSPGGSHEPRETCSAAPGRRSRINLASFAADPAKPDAKDAQPAAANAQPSQELPPAGRKPTMHGVHARRTPGKEHAQLAKTRRLAGKNRCGCTPAPSQSTASAPTPSPRS